MESNSGMLQDFYIISKEPDTGPVVVGMVFLGGFSALCLFIAMFSLVTILLEGFSMADVFSIMFLSAGLSIAALLGVTSACNMANFTANVAF